MINYSVKYNETISDILLNLTGKIDNWETVLSDNGFTTWTPDFTINQSLQITEENNQNTNIIELKSYPICNILGINDFETQSQNLIQDFTVNSQPDAATFQIIAEAKQKTYSIKFNETVSDVVMNLTGSILNWETFLNDNNLNTWTPDFTVNQIALITDLSDLLQTNIIYELNSFPICNVLGISDFEQQSQSIINQLGNTYIFEDSEFKEFEDVELFNFDN